MASGEQGAKVAEIPTASCHQLREDQQHRAQFPLKPIEGYRAARIKFVLQLGGAKHRC